MNTRKNEILKFLNSISAKRIACFDDEGNSFEIYAKSGKQIIFQFYKNSASFTYYMESQISAIDDCKKEIEQFFNS